VTDAQENLSRDVRDDHGVTGPVARTFEWEYGEPLPADLAAPMQAEDAMLRSALALTAALDLDRVCEAMLAAVERVFDAPSSWIVLSDQNGARLRVSLFRGAGKEAFSGTEISPNQGLVGYVFSHRRVVFVPDVRTETRWYDPPKVHGSSLRSALIVPLVFADQVTGVIGLDSPRYTAERPPTAEDLRRLRILAAQASIGIANARLYEASQEDRRRMRTLLKQRRELRGRLTLLRTEVDGERGSTEFVGEHPAVRDLLAEVQQVAGADLTVLLLGETGTGKELIARTLHAQSTRTSRSFVPVNCAAMPQTLIESELFGHERGAFTGAQARKPGRFELANRGTLFLDEIGDLPLEAQAKLLRVLQDGIVQRIGSTDSIKVDVRVIAATNQDLATLVGDGRFRADLFYRLNVFPLRIPALRERREDIPILARHFISRCAARLNRRITAVEEDVWDQLQRYDWPGNVRELQNVIERAIILAGPDGVLRSSAIRLDLLPPLASPAPAPAREHPHTPGAPDPQASDPVTLSDTERRAILTALRRCRGRVSGKSGAASLLGLKPTTLHAKMKKLGISRDDVWDS
jgi:formate hydrogenlyase transcriptional activator